MDKGRKVTLLALFVLGLYLVTPVAAAIAVSPGSTSSVASFPVTQTITGLTASTAYIIVCITDGNSTTEFTSDSDGEATVTITPANSGDNTYVLEAVAGVNTPLAIWTVDNLDIMIYLLPMVGLMVTFAIIAAVLKAVKF